MITLPQAELFYIPQHVLSAQIARIAPSVLHFNSQQRARDKYLSRALFDYQEFPLQLSFPCYHHLGCI